MSWNYRAVRKVFSYDGHEEIAIHSVHYDNNGQMNGMSFYPENVMSYSLPDVEAVLELMKDALQKPILDYEASSITPEQFGCLPLKRVELINGYIVQLPHRVFRDGVLVAALGSALLSFVTRTDFGQVAAGGSFLLGPRDVRTPALSLLSHADLNGEDTDDIVGKAPTLAVEVATETENYQCKADEFLAAGTKAVWVVNSRRRTVAVHTPDDLPKIYQMGDAISGGEVLPDFNLPLADIFES